MRIGFTGAREGMSRNQSLWLKRLLNRLLPDEFHYGTHAVANLFSDAEAHSIALGVCGPDGCIPHHAESGKELARNSQLVSAIDVLIAAPATDKEELRSGTWATVRYARGRGLPVIMLSRGDV